MPDVMAEPAFLCNAKPQSREASYRTAPSILVCFNVARNFTVEKSAVNQSNSNYLTRYEDETEAVNSTEH